VSRHQKGKTNLDFTEARDGEWQWHQLGHMQVCTSLQTDNHASTTPLSFLQAGCPSCRPTKSVNAPKAKGPNTDLLIIMKQLYIVCVVWCLQVVRLRGTRQSLWRRISSRLTRELIYFRSVSFRVSSSFLLRFFRVICDRRGGISRKFPEENLFTHFVS